MLSSFLNTILYKYILFYILKGGENGLFDVKNLQSFLDKIRNMNINGNIVDQEMV